jgi:hypothetical protein
MKTTTATGAHAFTITEMMISTAVLTVVLGGLLTTHLFAARLFQLTKAKLGANQDARIAISKLGDEIRTAKWIRVGFGSASSFTESADDTAQAGTAIELYSTPSTNPCIRYFLDTNANALYRVTTANPTPDLIANFVTNRVVFTSENSSGVTLTNNENNRVIGLCLSFYQIQYPIIKIGPGEYYDYYQLRTRFTRRTLE